MSNLGNVLGTLLVTLILSTVYGLIAIAILNLVTDVDYTFSNVVFSILATAWLLLVTNTKINGESR